METLEKIRARGDSDFSANDFDSMPFLVAFGKVSARHYICWRELTPHSTQEVLRVYPTATELVRVPSKDDVLPLSKPIVGISGKVYKELPITAGTSVSIAILGYNWYVLFIPVAVAGVGSGFNMSQEQGRLGIGRLRVPTRAVAQHERKARNPCGSLRQSVGNLHACLLPTS